MKIVAFTGLAALGFVLSACATIVEGTTQSVSLTTPPAEGAKCELKNSQGTWYITSPGSVVVHKTKTDLQVLCKKDGFADAATVIPAKFGATTAANIIAGGVIGVGIDAASGANYSYANATSVPMTPAGAQAAAPQASQPGAAEGKPTS